VDIVCLGDESRRALCNMAVLDGDWAMDVVELERGPTWGRNTCEVPANDNEPIEKRPPPRLELVEAP